MSMDVENGSAVSVSYPVTLSFPAAPESYLNEASGAIRQEYRDSVRVKRLRCRAWEHLSERDDGSIYVLEIGRFVEFDWTWEGAIAYRPGASGGSSADEDALDADDEEQMFWCGEIVEIDATRGRIFVSVSNPDHTPTTGSFYVRPFEFLERLNAVYNDNRFQEVRPRLAPRLVAAAGGVYPRIDGSVSQGLAELQPLWERSWGILWGPPGTGKTYTIGRQVASCLDDPSERILVVSTTNKATDGAALSIGKACALAGSSACEEGRALRVGKGVHIKSFRDAGLEGMIRGTEAVLLHQVADLGESLRRETVSEIKADLRDQIKKLLQQISDASRHFFQAADVRVVAATAFRAIAMLGYEEYRTMIERGEAPFTTVIIDEAGLISRAATAVLSLLASRRVVLAGDPKQLAPISRMSRVLPTSQARWLGSSGLEHLDRIDQGDEGMHLLDTQYRMHPEVGELVSAYQYKGRLKTADSVRERSYCPPPLLQGQPRTIWYVLDDDGKDIPAIRAERGPGNRSWVRAKTHEVLDKLFKDDALANSDSLFISPFAAQAKEMATSLAKRGLTQWTASTVHSQQGAEADIVVFDTVNASSTSWPIHEWLRLVNVALSRAREFVFVIASRAEMQSPYLRPLLKHLNPQILKYSGSTYKWLQVLPAKNYQAPAEIESASNLLGNQIIQRKAIRPVLSAEQQRLCGLKLGGGPRLVRGVAGSGKTAVLAHWLAKTLDELDPKVEGKVWAVYANRSLATLLSESVEAAWDEQHPGVSFPWHRVEILHIRDVLGRFLPQVGLYLRHDEFDYDHASANYLDRMAGKEIKPCCKALFVDEGQDLGPHTLKLLGKLVELREPAEPKNRSIHIFYDNAQNVYGRGTPKWSELDLNMQGRSTVMKESFRSTKPITEFAFNVLHQLCPDEANHPDHKELVERGLIECGERAEFPWWNVRFTQIDGPAPIFRKCLDRDSQATAIGNQLLRWIRDEGVRPRDICVLFMGDHVRDHLLPKVAAILDPIGVRVKVQTSRVFHLNDDTVLATTPHSFKGYDAEVVVVPCVEQFHAKGKLLTQALYVAMTRARSVLAMFGTQSERQSDRSILGAIERCYDAISERPKVEPAVPASDEFEDLVSKVGEDHADWLRTLNAAHRLVQEPMLRDDLTVLCEPLFRFDKEGCRYACFPERKPSQRVRCDVEDAGVRILHPGDKI